MSQRGVAIKCPAAQPPVKPEDSVPAAVGGQISGEHEEPEERFLGWTQEPEHPDLRVKDVARPGSPDLVDCALEQRQQVGRPPSALMEPAWQKTSMRPLSLRSASMTSMGSCCSSNLKPANASGAIRAAARSSVNVVATARSRRQPEGGLSASRRSVRLSGASKPVLPAVCDVVEQSRDGRPPEVQPVRS